MYINLLYLSLFNFAYPFFLSFLLNIFVCFLFIGLFPNWHLAFVLFSSLCFSQFYSSRYNFWFPLLTMSIYCTLFLLDCFDFAYGCICIYSVTFFIVVIILCLYTVLLQFCEFSFFFLFFLSSSVSFLFLTILTFLNLLHFFLHLIFVCLSYCSFPLAVNL